LLENNGQKKSHKKSSAISRTGRFCGGAEETMAIGKERIEWNDKKVIQEYL